MSLAPAWTGDGIDVTLHRARWLACMGLTTSVTFMAAIFVRAGVGLPLAIGALALSALLLLAVLWPAVAALRAGFLVRMDAGGIRVAGRKAIAWRDVQALEVEAKRLRVHCTNGSEIALPLFFARFDPVALPQAVHVSSQVWRACHG